MHLTTSQVSINGAIHLTSLYNFCPLTVAENNSLEHHISCMSLQNFENR